MVGAWIERMDRWLAANRPEYYAILQPGASEEDLSGFEARFSVQLSAAFCEVYRWRNGQDPGSSEAMQGNRTFSCLEVLADTMNMLDGMIGYDFEDPRYWRRGWIPFLHNGGGSHLCLDVAAEDGGQRGQLVGFWKQDEDRPVEYPSLEAWIESLVASMEAGSLERISADRCAHPRN